jgi:hypothetical protein
LWDENEVKVKEFGQDAPELGQKKEKGKESCERVVDEGRKLVEVCVGELGDRFVRKNKIIELKPVTINLKIIITGVIRNLTFTW